ncbi:MAG: hypothetical protein J6D10_11275 [Clostridia bacterium]|nr:hypothetical protein [Clostridia bacterium]
MEELTFGTVVQSVCGRDRYRVFLIVEIDDSDPVRPVVIADGSLRKLAGRKHKNPAHLRFVARPTEEELSRLREAPDDGQILTICKKYDLLKNNFEST